MNWYLIKSTYNAQPLQMMFWGDANTAVTIFMLAGQVSGGAQAFVWGSGTWQPMGPAHPINY
jgi:hypothetical protein